MVVMQMPIWTSSEKDIRLLDAGGDFLSMNIFAGDSILSIMLEREEIETMTLALMEWCGIPFFKSQMEESDTHAVDDDISP